MSNSRDIPNSSLGRRLCKKFDHRHDIRYVTHHTGSYDEHRSTFIQRGVLHSFHTFWWSSLAIPNSIALGLKTTRAACRLEPKTTSTLSQLRPAVGGDTARWNAGLPSWTNYTRGRHDLSTWLEQILPYFEAETLQKKVESGSFIHDIEKLGFGSIHDWHLQFLIPKAPSYGKKKTTIASGISDSKSCSEAAPSDPLEQCEAWRSPGINLLNCLLSLNIDLELCIT